ncbi:bifunctional diaminohydroxyphosphoribosylaminopyrimidine deaminase/5-amino-6-(5-phosphoribosylamino)uracil reductase RibD [Arachidicoccus soli]|uniref:Riboflavin biosynthesis protein RibD n=1 Tax=Arachidicoccus soli TaxID=2341117 RepID=A0A386HMQ5_9BACT|nr:bifunctional diaminohydroxyphosphoribosylaminopyrimidine deaminase/5-amino-6-(5-phosphoribosylamino)uracil reductase RibD [Arachidicoccus soli]AYD46896.1 bifunctional diaminohydroxyphosphoribosylaminopyrimidine deaminase/5-amino-6-(5-phosphoribosylamino)uracil reductase RibD [Arachidicoccus soli]
MKEHSLYIQRCLQLAQLGAGNVAPNPMVGAVLVYNNRIIGEGWHQKYGEAHAEVHCINSVKPTDRDLIPQATLYISLEPCSHFGKTPPCSDLIIQEKIQKVVIGCVDAFVKVNGSGIEKLRNAGIEVVLGDWSKECKDFNKRFFTFHLKKRPYIILKWAQTANKKIASLKQHNETERLLITNELSNRLVHKWRSQEAAIMIGKNTALLDNPSLTNRNWTGKNPIRILIDKNLEIAENSAVFNKEAKTIIFNQQKDTLKENLHFCKISFEDNTLKELLSHCYHLNIQSILVEGGAKLLQSFINENLWDECRIVTNKDLIIENGLSAPLIENAYLEEDFVLLNNHIEILKPTQF